VRIVARVDFVGTPAFALGAFVKRAEAIIRRAAIAYGWPTLPPFGA